MKLIALAVDHGENLLAITANRHHQAAAVCQLRQQIVRNIRTGARRENTIERRLCLPAKTAIGMLELHLGQTQLQQAFAGLILQGTNAFHRIQLITKRRQYRGLIAATGANFQHLARLPVGNQQLGHARNHPGLGNGLPMTDRQGGIVIGLVRQGFFDKQVSWCIADGVQYALVLNTGVTQALH